MSDVYSDLEAYNIVKENVYSAREAYNIVKEKGPSEKLEKIISKNPFFSFLYSCLVLKEPFLLGEPTIVTSWEVAFNYSYHVLKSRFKLCENNLLNENVLGALWPWHEDFYQVNWTYVQENQIEQYMKHILKFNHE